VWLIVSIIRTTAANEIGRDVRAMKKVGEALWRCAAGTRLAGPLPVSTSLDAYIGNELSVARKALLVRHPKRGLRRIAFASLWQPLIPFDLLSSMGVVDIASLLHAEDPFSLLCGFELCRARLHDDAAFADLGTSFLKKLLLEEKASMGRCHM